MGKNVDYCISAVRYDGGRRHIDKVRVHAVAGDSIGNACEIPRSEVAAAMGVMRSFITITEDADGNWVKAGDVRIIEVNGKKHLRTDCMKEDSDSFGNLPEF